MTEPTKLVTHGALDAALSDFASMLGSELGTIKRLGDLYIERVVGDVLEERLARMQAVSLMLEELKRLETEQRAEIERLEARVAALSSG